MAVAIVLVVRATRTVVWGELTTDEMRLTLNEATEVHHDPPLLGRFLCLKPVAYPLPQSSPEAHVAILRDQ